VSEPSLAGLLVRIDRAANRTLQLTAACKAFLGTRPYTIEERPDESPTTRAFVVTALADVSMLPRIIAGEIAHHLRASLDLMFYELMLRNGVTDQKLLRKSVFPVLDKDLTTPRAMGEYYAAIKRAIGPLPAAQRQRIEHLEPANTSHEWSHLAQVQRLDNTQQAPAAARRCSEHTAQRLELPRRNRQGHDDAAPFVRAAIQTDMLLKVGDTPPGFVLLNLAQEVCFMEGGPVFLQPMTTTCAT
jgi:hypothetical protein